MKITRQRPLVALLALSCLVLVAIDVHAGDAKLELKLGRQIKEFDQYLLKASSTRITDMTLTSAIGHQEDKQVDTTTILLDAMVDVKQVTEDGQEAVKLIDVRNAALQQRGQMMDLVPTGTIIQAQFSDSGTVLKRDGQPVKDDLIPFLLAVIRSEGGTRTAKIMDRGRPVAVGESWKVDSASLIEALDPSGAVTPVSVSGTVTFVGIDSTQAKTAAIVRLVAEAIDAIGEIDGAKPMASRIKLEVNLTVPLDTRYPPLATSSTTIMEASFDRNGAQIDMRYEVRDSFRFIR